MYYNWGAVETRGGAFSFDNNVYSCFLVMSNIFFVSVSYENILETMTNVLSYQILSKQRYIFRNNEK